MWPVEKLVILCKKLWHGCCRIAEIVVSFVLYRGFWCSRYVLTELVFSVVPYTVTDRTVGMKDSYLLKRVSNSNTFSGGAWTSRTTIPLPDLPSLYCIWTLSPRANAFLFSLVRTGRFKFVPGLASVTWCICGRSVQQLISRISCYFRWYGNLEDLWHE